MKLPAQDDKTYDEAFQSIVVSQPRTHGLIRDRIIYLLMKNNAYRLTKQAMHRYDMLCGTLSSTVKKNQASHTWSTSSSAGASTQDNTAEVEQAIATIYHSYPDIFTLFGDINIARSAIQRLISEIDAGHLDVSERDPTSIDTGVEIMNMDDNPLESKASSSGTKKKKKTYLSPSGTFQLPKDAMNMPGRWIIYTKDITSSKPGAAIRVNLSVRPSHNSSLSIWCWTFQDYTNWLAETLYYSPNRCILIAIFKDESHQIRQRRVVDDLTFQVAIQDACLAGKLTFQFRMVPKIDGPFNHDLNNHSSLSDYANVPNHVIEEELVKIEYCAYQASEAAETDATFAEIKNMMSWKDELLSSGFIVDINPLKYQDFPEHVNLSICPPFRHYGMKEAKLKEWIFPLLAMDYDDHQKYSSIAVEVWMTDKPGVDNLRIQCWSLADFMEFLMSQLGFNSASQDIIYYRDESLLGMAQSSTEIVVQTEFDFRFAVEQAYLSNSDACVFYLKQRSSASKIGPTGHVVDGTNCSQCKQQYLMQYREKHQLACELLKETLKKILGSINSTEDEDVIV